MAIEFSSHFDIKSNSSSREIFMTPDDFSALRRKVDHIDLEYPKTPNEGTFSFFQIEARDDFDPVEPKTWQKKDKKIDKYVLYMSPYLSKETAPITFIRLLSKIKRDIANRENPTTTNMSLAEEELKRQSEVEENEAKEFYRIHPNLVDSALEILYTKLKV